MLESGVGFWVRFKVKIRVKVRELAGKCDIRYDYVHFQLEISGPT